MEVFGYRKHLDIQHNDMTGLVRFVSKLSRDKKSRCCIARRVSKGTTTLLALMHERRMLVTAMKVPVVVAICVSLVVVGR